MIPAVSSTSEVRLKNTELLLIQGMEELCHLTTEVPQTLGWCQDDLQLRIPVLSHHKILGPDQIATGQVTAGRVGNANEVWPII